MYSPCGCIALFTAGAVVITACGSNGSIVFSIVAKFYLCSLMNRCTKLEEILTSSRSQFNIKVIGQRVLCVFFVHDAA